MNGGYVEEKGIGSEEEMVKLWSSLGNLVIIRSYALLVARKTKVTKSFLTISYFQAWTRISAHTSYSTQSSILGL